MEGMCLEISAGKSLLLVEQLANQPSPAQVSGHPGFGWASVALSGPSFGLASVAAWRSSFFVKLELMQHMIDCYISRYKYDAPVPVTPMHFFHNYPNY
jgi:hypothetical protein